MNILIPYNFSRSDEKTVDYVIENFSGNKDAEVDILHLYIPMPSISADRTTVLNRMSESLNYLNKRITELETELDAVKASFVRSGFPEEKVKTFFKAKQKTIAQEIIDMAQNKPYDMVILNRATKTITGFFSGSVFTKVVSSLKNIPVLVLT